MNEARAHAPPEDHAYLWLMVTPPMIWGAHFGVSYISASLWCARFAGRDGVATTVRTLILWLTVAALAGIAIVGWDAYRRLSHDTKAQTQRRDRDTPEDRHRFLGYATFLLAGLSALSTVFTALAASFFDTCY